MEHFIYYFAGAEHTYNREKIGPWEGEGEGEE